MGLISTHVCGLGRPPWSLVDGLASPEHGRPWGHWGTVDGEAAGSGVPRRPAHVAALTAGSAADSSLWPRHRRASPLGASALGKGPQDKWEVVTRSPLVRVLMCF